MAPVGGAEIGFTVGTAGFYCSIGVPATFNGIPGYVTAAHCSAAPGVSNGSVITQPLNGPELGRKYWDPAFSPNYLGSYTTLPSRQCFPGYQCRVSDAAFYAKTDGSRTFLQGYAATSFLDVPGNISVGNVTGIGLDRTQTFYGAQTTASNPNAAYTWDYAGYPGMLVYKVGRSSGERNGNVVNTCYDVKYSALSLSISCVFTVSTYLQGAALPFDEGGDSGGPVYTDHGGTYWLAGLIAGVRSNTDVNDIYVYTPWENVDMEVAMQFNRDARTILVPTRPH